MAKEIGVSGSLGIKEFITIHKTDELGLFTTVRRYASQLLADWLCKNPDLEIIDIHYSGDRILTIYRKEGMI